MNSQKFILTTVQMCKICYWRRVASSPLPPHHKGCKPMHQLLPIWEGERLLEPCSFPESSKVSHMHPDSLATHERVCGKCSRNPFSSPEPPVWLLTSIRLPVPRGSCMPFIRAHLPIQAPISTSKKPRSSPHSVLRGIPTQSLALSSGALPETLHFRVCLPECSTSLSTKGGCDSPSPVSGSFSSFLLGLQLKTGKAVRDLESQECG